MPRVLISYRRSDTAGMTGRIFDRLVAHYGKESVFIDVDNIPFGTDFREHIRRALLEIEAALQGGIPLIPVLVDDARMPKTADLPASLQEFAFRNAVEIDSGRDF